MHRCKICSESYLDSESLVEHQFASHTPEALEAFDITTQSSECDMVKEWQSRSTENKSSILKKLGYTPQDVHTLIGLEYNQLGNKLQGEVGESLAKTKEITQEVKLVESDENKTYQNMYDSYLQARSAQIKQPFQDGTEAKASENWEDMELDGSEWSFTDSNEDVISCNKCGKTFNVGSYPRSNINDIEYQAQTHSRLHEPNPEAGRDWTHPDNKRDPYNFYNDGTPVLRNESKANEAQVCPNGHMTFSQTKVKCPSCGELFESEVRDDNGNIIPTDELHRIARGESKASEFEMKDFKENEEYNNHSENALELAKIYGTSEEISDMERIVRDHTSRGFNFGNEQDMEDYNRRYEIQSKYWNTFHRSEWDQGRMYHESKASEDITFADTTPRTSIQKDMIEFIRGRGGSASELDIDRKFDLLNNFDNESRHLQSLVNDGTLTMGGWKPDNSGNDGYTDGSYLYNLNESKASERRSYEDVWNNLDNYKRETILVNGSGANYDFHTDETLQYINYSYDQLPQNINQLVNEYMDYKGHTVEWSDLSDSEKTMMNNMGYQGESKASEADWDHLTAEDEVELDRNIATLQTAFYKALEEEDSVNSTRILGELERLRGIKITQFGSEESKASEGFDQGLFGYVDAKCKTCGIEFDSISDMDDHYKNNSDHISNIDEISQIIPNTESLGEALKSHTDYHKLINSTLSGEVTLSCSQCAKKFKAQESLDIHYNDSHANSELKSLIGELKASEEETMDCQVCKNPNAPKMDRVSGMCKNCLNRLGESKSSEVNGKYVLNGMVIGKVTDFEPNNWFGKVELDSMPEFAEFGTLDPLAVVEGDDGVTYKDPQGGSDGSRGTLYDDDGNPTVDVTSYGESTEKEDHEDHFEDTLDDHDASDIADVDNKKEFFDDLTHESKANEYSIKEEFDLQDQDGKYEMLSKADLSVTDATNYSTYSHDELPEEVKDSLKGDGDTFGESKSKTN